MNPEGKREALMHSAETLFVTQGYSGTTIAQIAKHAEIAVGSVYRLYPDKAAVLTALHERMEERFIHAMQAGWTSKDDYAERFEAMIAALFDLAFDVRASLPLYFLTRDMIGGTNFVPGERIIAEIEAQFFDGVESGKLRAMTPGVIGPMAHAIVEGAMRAWMADPSPQRRELIVTEVTAIFVRSFLLDDE